MNTKARNHFVNVLFGFSVLFAVTVAARVDMLLHSEDKIIVSASSTLPGEVSSSEDTGGTQVPEVTIMATPTVTPTPEAAGIKEAVGTSTPTPTPTATTTVSRELNEAVGEPNEITVKRQICDVFKYACDRALRVARCESNFNPNAKNSQPGSTASGLFEIVRGTWNLYKCEGDPFNAHDNAVCAKKIYDRNGAKFNTGGGWNASHACHHQD